MGYEKEKYESKKLSAEDVKEKILKALSNMELSLNCHRDLKEKREQYNSGVQACIAKIKQVSLR